MTHSALSNKSWGILSGTFMISSITTAAFSRRSVSFSAAPSGTATNMKPRTKPKRRSMDASIDQQVVADVESFLNLESRYSGEIRRIHNECSLTKADQRTMLQATANLEEFP